MNFCKNFFMYFTSITTGTLLACAVLESEEMLSSDVLWQILFIGFLGGLITSVLIVKIDMPKREAVVRFGIHYILINMLVLGAGYFFHWYNWSFASVIVMMVTIILVYVFVSGVSYVHSKQIADKINEKLSRRNKDI